MPSFPRITRTNTVAYLLFGAALFVFYLTVCRLDPATSIQNGFEPWPDGPEALDSAVNLARNGSFSIHLAGQEHPPRYPFGYGLLGACAILLGATPETALYRVNEAAALAVLVLVFLFFARRGRGLNGGLAALILASSPAFIVLCRGPRSEIPSLAILAAGWVCLIPSDGARSRFRGPIGALLLGASLWFRISNLLLLPFLAAAVVGEGRQTLDGLVRRSGKLFFWAFWGVLPLLVYHWIAFGNPLRTGYTYWLTGHNSLNAFRIQYVPAQVEYLWREIWQRDNIFRTAHIYGDGAYLNLSLAALMIVGSTRLPRTRRFWSCLAAGGIYTVAMLFYFYVDFRLYLPVFVLLLVASIDALVEWAEWKRRRGANWAVALAFALALAAVFGVPGKKGWSSLVDLADMASLQKATQPYALIERARQNLPDGAVILTNLNQPYVHALGRRGWIVAPLSSKHDYRFNPRNFSFDESNRDALARRQLDSGLPLAAINTDGLDDLTRKCPLPEPHAWKPLYNDQRGGVVAVASP